MFGVWNDDVDDLHFCQRTRKYTYQPHTIHETGIIGLHLPLKKTPNVGRYTYTWTVWELGLGKVVSTKNLDVFLFVDIFRIRILPW